MRGLLYNRYVLYFIFLIALTNFLYLGYIRDDRSIAIFVLIGILTSFFNKNMIIVLSSAMIVTNVLKYGCSHSYKEGLSDDKEEGTETTTDDMKKEKKSKDKESKDKKSKDDEEEEESKDKKKNKKPKVEEEEDNSKKKNIKEDFGQDEKVVYTSVEDKANDEEKMILAQEKLLKKMNKYKPLLDTIQGITKNIAIVKGFTNSANSLEDDTIDKLVKK